MPSIGYVPRGKGVQREDDDRCPLPQAEPWEQELLIAHPYTRERLVEWGRMRVDAFCKANDLPRMKITATEVYKGMDWPFDACAFWRHNECWIAPSRCARVATDAQLRNWNWPGSPTDRTPYGVVCHELGHHADHNRSKAMGLRTGAYYGGYSIRVRKASGERRLTSYCPNDEEWFAEIFRLFVTNHALLYEIRPRTWNILMDDGWVPVSDSDWMAALGKGCPDRMLRAAQRR